MTITNERTITSVSQPVICIGGANIDRKFYVKQKLVPETSNPATSSATVGGVARNIAENLGRLGQDVVFISAAGNDLEWKMIEEASAPFMDLEHVEKLEGKATGSYTAILDHNRDLALALADMEIFDSITPELLKQKASLLKQAACIVVDLNCPKESIAFLSQFALKHAIPLIIIPVSSPKMDRLPKQLEAVTWLIVNKDETETFLNVTMDSKQAWKQAVRKWLALGIKNVIVTNGAEGVVYGNPYGDVTFYPAVYTPDVVDVTGAGDSFCSAVIHMWLKNEKLDPIIYSGLVNSHKTIISEHTVRKDLTENQLRNDMEEILHGKIS